ncbi:guanylate-binding protein 2-like, partial [Mercenaria mercenaria]|uniref:guanylate-binding protein 2-like n=1 Tax=Mercenaria mercenaria TaxID=6596 RepID=UPI00234E88CC
MSGIFEKSMELKDVKECHVAVAEDAIMDHNNVPGEDGDKDVKLVKLVGISGKPCLTSDKDGHLAVVGGKSNDLEELPGNDGKKGETMVSFEGPMTFECIKDDQNVVVEDEENENMSEDIDKNGFILGSSIESSTKGIWAWCRKHATKESQVLLLLDTEGLGDVRMGSIDHDNKIFTIATLPSSTLVYNTMSSFNQEAIEKLTYITMLSSNLKVTPSSSSDDLFDCIMPHFVLCLRDFNLALRIDGEEITEDEYLDDCLQTKEVKSLEDEKYNRPRECIKKYFTRRKVFTFDRPAGRSVMRRLDSARDEDLNEDFIQETERFMSY